MKPMLNLFITFSVLGLLWGCGGDEPAPTPPSPVTGCVVIGTPGLEGHTYLWEPASQMDDATKAQPCMKATKTTVATVTATTKCGSSKSSVTVRVYKEDGKGGLVEVK